MIWLFSTSQTKVNEHIFHSEKPKNKAFKQFTKSRAYKTFPKHVKIETAQIVHENPFNGISVVVRACVCVFLKLPKSLN